MRSIAQKRFTAVGRVAAKRRQMRSKSRARIAVGRLRHAERDAHRGGDADGRRTAHDHVLDRACDVAVIAIDAIDLLHRQQSLIEQDDGAVAPLDRTNHSRSPGLHTFHLCVVKAEFQRAWRVRSRAVHQRKHVAAACRRSARPRSIEQLAVDEDVLDADRALNQSRRAAGQIVHELGALQTDARRIEEHQVRGAPGAQLAAPGRARRARRHAGEQAHGFLEAQRAELAHPVRQQRGGEALIGERVDVRAGIGQRHDAGRMAQQLADDRPRRCS